MMQVQSQVLWVSMMLLLLASGLCGCYRTDYYTGPDARLRFSTDTLVFDTVFTTVGSATRILKVYNDLDQAVEIGSIGLEGAGNSPFRLNIDGVPGYSASRVEIAAHDSLYIFGEVTVDPDQPVSSSPFVIQEKLLFNINGQNQEVLLEAWGQNANYIPGKFARGKAYLTTCDMETIRWDDPRPYVVYGTLLIDSCTLVLPPGTQVYVHGGFARSETGQEYNDGQIYFLSHGKIRVEGTAESPVVFQTDRLEHAYDDVSGLWSGLYFVEGSSDNRVDHALIKNANIGIFLDSAGTMNISHTRILHTVYAGIYARQAKLTASNCLLADNGGYGLFLRYGGEYQLDFVTVANYDNQEEALYMGNYQCLDPLCSEISLYPLKARMRNCIFYGNGKDELFFEDASPEENTEWFDYRMDRCLVAVDELLKVTAFDDFFTHCFDCLEELDPEAILFRDISAYDFRPDTSSVLIDRGIFIPTINDDLEGTIRDEMPDIGCYEFRP